jgi:UDP-glucose 4-epimerase
MKDKKTVFVTGINGYIAYYTVKEALSRGYKVVGNIQTETFRWSSEFAKELESGDLRVYKGVDMRDEAGVYHMIERCDMGIHLAGVLGTKSTRNPKDFINVNVMGALNVLEACTIFNLPVVLIGVGNHFENNNYSISKTMAERYGIMYARFNGTRCNVVRALNAVGARQKVKNTGKILPTFITKAIKGEDISVYGGKEHCSVMDLIYAGDVAKVLLDVLEKTASGEIAPGTNTYEAGTGIEPTVWDIAEMVLKSIKEHGVETKSQIIEVPMRAGESNNSRVVANNPYPMEYTDINKVIDEAVEYYLNNEWD